MTDNTQLTAGRIVWTARKDKGWTQEEVCTKLTKNLGIEISQSYLARFEHDRMQDPDPEILRVLAEILGLDYINLLAPIIRKKYGLTPETMFTLTSDTLSLQELARWITATTEGDLFVVTGSEEFLTASSILEAIAGLLVAKASSSVTFFLPPDLNPFFEYYKVRILSQTGREEKALLGVQLPVDARAVLTWTTVIANTGLSENHALGIQPVGYAVLCGSGVSTPPCIKLSHRDTVERLPALAKLRQAALGCV